MCPDILEFSKIETSEMDVLGRTLLFVVLIVSMSTAVRNVAIDGEKDG